MDDEVTKPKGGPRTQLGKARSAKNAFKHGLSTSSFPDAPSFAAMDAVYVKTLQVQERLLQAVEEDLLLLQLVYDAPTFYALDKSMEALIAVERYVGRSFTKRQTAFRRGLIEDHV